MNTVSQETIKILKETIPFLQENGTKLTESFYRRMFEKNPEVKEFFNTSNQNSGAQPQALSGAICAFAQNIETPEKLASAINRIANKHASLMIQPEHYPIVGEHLIASIDTLLDPAPPEILEAWTEAYQFLAGVMIDAEAQLYKAQKHNAGGWNGFRKMRIYKKEKESQWITSFYLRPVDPCPVIPFKAGQYLTIRVPTSSTSQSQEVKPQTTMRNYSLSGSPAWDHYRISVKREIPHHSDTPEGYVSSYLHTQVNVGDVLEIGPPCGDFFLQEHHESTPILLLSGGVGITPLLSMLHSIKHNPTLFLHAAINGDIHALREEVLQLADKKQHIDVHFRYSEPTHQDQLNQNFHSEGFVSTEFLRDFISSETEVYFCGPKPMMSQVMKSLRALNHPQDKIHFEFFGPHEELED